MYDEMMIAPMRTEMKDMGFTEVKSAVDVKTAIEEKGTALVVINSVCGSAASITRPAIRGALEKAGAKPDRLITAFAGNDIEAVDQIRTHLAEFPPSSPFVALFRDGKIAHALQRPVFKTLPLEHVEPMIQSMLDKFAGAEVKEDVQVYAPGQEAYVPNTCRT